jgi:hypothetical protein
MSGRRHHAGMSKSKSKPKQRSIRRRDVRRGREVVFFPGPLAGPGVVVPTPEQVLEALSGFQGDAPWEELAPDLLPMFERRRPMPPEVPPSLTVVLPPGVTVGFGIDLGPASVRVSRMLLESWGISVEELTTTALANLRRRAFAPALPPVVREPIAGHPTIAFQSEDGWASALLLAPDALERVMGVEPRLFIAPMRDLLVGLPPDVDPEMACWLTEEFEALDPNALALEGFLWRDRTLTCQPIRPTAMSA